MYLILYDISNPKRLKRVSVRLLEDCVESLRHQQPETTETCGKNPEPLWKENPEIRL